MVRDGIDEQLERDGGAFGAFAMIDDGGEVAAIAANGDAARVDTERNSVVRDHFVTVYSSRARGT